MIRLGVRSWLTLCYGLMLCVILIAFSLAVYLLVRHNIHSRLEFELDEELVELRQEVELAVDLTDLKRQIALRFGPHFTYEYEVSDKNGTSLFVSDRLKSTRLRSTSFAGLTAGRYSELQQLPELGSYLVAGEIFSSRLGPLLIQVATPMEGIDSLLHGLVLVFLTAGPLTLCAAMICGYALAWTALAPVGRIAAIADEITAQRLDQRLEISPIKDELTHLATTLNRMMDRLQQSFVVLEQFTADAAHELRTPLTVIRNEAEVTLRAPRSGTEYEATLKSIVEETTLLGKLTDQLLTLCSVDSQWNASKSETVPLEETVVEAIEGLQTIAQQKQVTINVQMDRSLLVVGDPVLLRRLWYNLIDNSIKYTAELGSIQIRTKHDDSSVTVEISDTGCGIAPQHVPHIFKRFYRVDESRQRRSGGTGLGLAICQSIVDSHGGSIRIESTVGIGTTIIVRLPCVPASAVLAEAGVSQESQPKGNG